MNSSDKSVYKLFRAFGSVAPAYFVLAHIKWFGTSVSARPYYFRQMIYVRKVWWLAGGGAVGPRPLPLLAREHSPHLPQPGPSTSTSSLLVMRLTLVLFTVILLTSTYLWAIALLCAAHLSLYYFLQLSIVSIEVYKLGPDWMLQIFYKNSGQKVYNLFAFALANWSRVLLAWALFAWWSRSRRCITERI